MFFSRSVKFSSTHFPVHETQEWNGVKVHWFEKKFSQAFYKYWYPPYGSNACTLIAVITAIRMHMGKVKINYDDELSRNLILTLTESVLEGNTLHENLKNSNKLTNLNLTVPEAMTGTQHLCRNLYEWRSILYHEDMSTMLFKRIHEHLQEWLRRKKRELFIILIADNKSYLLAVQMPELMLFDSHQHLENGAVVARANIRQLKNLCEWLTFMMKICYSSEPDEYELSFLYIIHPYEDLVEP